MLPIVRVAKILAEIRKLDAEMPVHTVAVFVHIAQHPGCTTAHICEAVGIAQSTCNRNTLALGKINRHRQPGYDLITGVDDPADWRRKIYHLTPKGESVIASLGAIASKE